MTIQEELAKIVFTEHRNEIFEIGSMFGDIERRVLLEINRDMPDMDEGYLYHTAKMLALWSNSVQEHIIYVECGVDHVKASRDQRFKGMNVMQSKLYNFTHKLNNPDTKPLDAKPMTGKATIITVGKWSHENYEVSQSFRKKYELEMFSYSG